MWHREEIEPLTFYVSYAGTGAFIYEVNQLDLFNPAIYIMLTPLVGMYILPRSAWKTANAQLGEWHPEPLTAVSDNPVAARFLEFFNFHYVDTLYGRRYYART